MPKEVVLGSAALMGVAAVVTAFSLQSEEGRDVLRQSIQIHPRIVA